MRQTGLEGSPYLSVISCSRNDDHGGSMHKRMQTSLSALIEQLERFRIESEIILVDYNPPQGKPLLKDALKWPLETKYCTIRTVVVPYSIHQQFKDSDKIPLNVLLAQNVGIRKARGEFVLATLIDILFSNEFMKFVAERTISKQCFYRADRYDVQRDVININALDERLAYCRNRILFIQTRYGQIPVLRKKNNYLSKNLSHNGRLSKIPRLHTNAAGDFLLMAREKWHALRGYPEIDTLGRYVDGLMCYVAYYSGIKEKILPEECRIYHIDHDSHWRNTEISVIEKMLFYFFPDIIPLICRKLLRDILRVLSPNILATLGKQKKIEKSGAKPISLSNYYKLISDIAAGIRPAVFNDKSWGLGSNDLSEFIITKAAWED